MIKSVLLLLSFVVTFFSYAGVDHLLPKPQYLEKRNQLFKIDKLRLLTPVLESTCVDLIHELGGQISESTDRKLEIVLVDDIVQASQNKDEAYRLSVSSKTIRIEAIAEKGVYWALQTLRQLVIEEGDKKYIEGCYIIDYPAFRIRGFMQDVGRTYISLDELKREIAMLSRYKINTFHWHLTENQGWRLESKIFPMLNDSSSYERMHAQYYTLEEAKDLVSFCKRHNVLLIPEIDMPGHSLAFRKAFRHDMQSVAGTKILKLLMDEVCETFDVPYIHIGTDEVTFTNPDFVPDMVKHVRNHGKKVISWNPGWVYKEGEIDMTQLWSYRGKAQKGIPAIDSKYHYINHFDAFADIIALYNSRILNVTEGSADHAGSIIGMWHDRYVADEKELMIQNNFYPSILALSERAWQGGGSEYYDGNGTILPNDKDPIFQTFQNFETRMLWHKVKYFEGYPFAYVKQTNVKWKIIDAFPNNGDLTKSFPPEQSLADSYDYEGNQYNTKDATGAAIYLRHVWGNNIVNAFYENPQPNHTAYAYTYVYSDKEQNVGLWANFQNYSRSEMDLPPLSGKWDYKESRIWINEEEIVAPQWKSNHKIKSNETPLTNENFEVRPPINVKLNKGWNKVFLKLPVGQFTTPEVRLVKWMFACVFVTPDGSKEVDGLIYSPDKIK